MIKKATILFFLNENKARSTGEIPIYARVILDREKFELSTKEFISDTKDWDAGAQRFKKRHPTNQVLSELETRIQDAYQFLKFNDKPLTALALRTQLKGEKSLRIKLFDFLDEHYHNKVECNPSYTQSTKQTYNTTINHLKAFLEYSKRNTIRLTEVDANFIRQFDSYLQNRSIISKKALNKNSANKYHVNFKSMLFHALNSNLIEKNPYREFKFKSEPGRLTYLTDSELDRLHKHNLGGNQSLIRVRDIFIFSVYTGLRFSDAIALKEENIIKENTGIWICYTQQKTSNPNRIPMLKKALEIYKKYNQHRKLTGFVLPSISNQKQNAYLNHCGVNRYKKTSYAPRGSTHSRHNYIFAKWDSA